MGLPSLVIGPAPPSKVGTGAAGAVRRDRLLRCVGQASRVRRQSWRCGFHRQFHRDQRVDDFNMTPAETKDFYRGLLLTVEPETLAFFIEQGIANEMLFYLFTEKVVEEKGGVVNQYVNDPLDPNFEKFQHYVKLAMTYGLTAEPEPGAKRKSAESDKTDKSGKNEQRRCFERGQRAGHGLAALFRSLRLGAGNEVRRQPSDVRLKREDEGPARS